jgi:hypothetical protein
MSATDIQALGEAPASRELFLNFFFFGTILASLDPLRIRIDTLQMGLNFLHNSLFREKRISRKPPSVSSENPFTCLLPSHQGEVHHGPCSRAIIMLST